MENDTIWSKSVNLSVLKLPLELRDKYLNNLGLKALAEKTGGTYNNLNDYPKLLDNLEFNEKIKIINRTASTIDFQKYWIVISFLLLIEWTFRKQKGLL